MSAYDCVVIGGGHNGLTAAVLLAKRGKKVVVLERSKKLGGLAAAGVLQDTGAISMEVADSLGLGRFGLRSMKEYPFTAVAPMMGGELLYLTQNPLKGAEAIETYARAVQKKTPQLAEGAFRDAKKYIEFRSFVEKLSGVICDVMSGPAPMVFSPDEKEIKDWWGLIRQGIALRRLGGRDMMELLRLPPMCLADWLNEWFETPLLKAGRAFPGLVGGFAGPWSPGTATNLLLWECMTAPGIEGGASAYVHALELAARDAGVEIKLDVEVKSVVLDSEGVQGVEVETAGVRTSIEARVVAASCDPKQVFTELVPSVAVHQVLESRMRNWRTRGTTAMVYLAQDVEMPAPEIRIASDLDGLERAFDPVKYRELPEHPAVEIFEGKKGQNATLRVHFVPYDLHGGWNSARKQTLLSTVQKVVHSALPQLNLNFDGAELLSPPDLESRYGITGGQIHHGEQGLDQLMARPAPECVRYRTPIKGLYLCGSGSFPGGGLTGMPGAQAAREIISQD